MSRKRYIVYASATGYGPFLPMREYNSKIIANIYCSKLRRKFMCNLMIYIYDRKERKVIYEKQEEDT